MIDRDGLLCGVISLRQLVIADPSALVGNLMDPEPVWGAVGTDQENAAHLMTRYSLLALPVISSEHRLIGVITIDDVMDVLEDEATEDIQRLGGAQPLERPYLDTSTFGIARKRIGCCCFFSPKALPAACSASSKVNCMPLLPSPSSFHYLLVPAVTGPAMSTLVDATGLFIYFTVARLIIGL